MRIITTRKLRFYNKNRTESFVSSGNNIIETCPDWAMEDAMFKAGRASGVIQIISSRSEQKELENNPEKHLPQNAHEEIKNNESENDQDDERAEESEEERAETPEERKARKRAERKARKRAEESEEE